jgi:beta-lactamase regulating signal transducer with metallopeptidase domain
VDTLLEFGLSNALVASGLAALAAVAGRLCRRPALTHGLWLLVLVKLVTPPVWPVSVMKIAPPGRPARLAEARETSPFLPPPAFEAFLEPAPDLDREPEDSAWEAAPRPLESTADVAAAEPEPLPQPVEFPWYGLALAVWLGGTVSYALIAAARTWRFGRLLRHAPSGPPDLEARVRRLGERIGLRRPPAVRMVPGPVSPMLWALAGRPLLLLPISLWARLREGQRDALIAHELAHLRRGDHCARRLELLATALFWWHPVVWWARRELRAAEEECCDAWVVWLLPRAAREYALALLETVDFVSDVRPALSLAASGSGHVNHLRRRLAMILHAKTPRALPVAGFWGLAALAALVLPFRPTWAQSPPADPTDPPADVRFDATQTAGEREPDQPAKPARRDPRLDRDETGQRSAAEHVTGVEDAREAVELMKAQLQVKQAEQSESEARVKQAQRRLERLRALAKTGAVSSEETAKAEDDLEIAQALLAQKRAQIHEVEVRFQLAARRLERTRGTGKPPPVALQSTLDPNTPTDNRPAEPALEQARKRIRELEEMLKGGGADPQAKQRVQALEEMLRAQNADRQKYMEALRAEAEKAQRALQDALKMRDQASQAAQAHQADLEKSKEEVRRQVAESERGSRDGSDRMRAVEAKLEALAREMEALRRDLKEMRKGSATPSNPAK